MDPSFLSGGRMSGAARHTNENPKSQIPNPKSKKTKVSKATSESRFWDLELGIWDLGFTDDLLTIY
jgi:hypothetical protein